MPQCSVNLVRLEEQPTPDLSETVIVKPDPDLHLDLELIESPNIPEGFSFEGLDFDELGMNAEATSNTKPDIGSEDEEFILPTPTASRSARNRKLQSRHQYQIPILRKILPRAARTKAKPKSWRSEPRQRRMGCKYPNCSFRCMQTSQLRKHTRDHLQSK
jgi:hypothetical protein